MVNRKLIILAVVLSFVTTVSIYYYLQKTKSALNGTVYEQTVVARMEIPAKTVISNEMLEVKDVPKGFRHQDSVENTKDLVGKLAAEKIYAGEQVLKPKVITQGDNSKGLAYQVPKGQRAVSLPVNDVSGVAGLIKPGDKVDVIATLDLDSANIGKVVQSGYILQNITVLAVNKNLEETGQNENGNEGQKTVTLAVLPQLVPQLVLSNEKGSVRLVLRGHTDEEVKNLLVFRLNNFLKEGE